TFKDKTTHNIHRLLRAIDTNTLLSKLVPHMQAQADEMMKAEATLEERFQELPSVIRNTRKLLDECTFKMDLGSDKNKAHVTGSDESDWDTLVTAAWEGFHRRYDPSNATYRARLQRELDVIRLKHFTTYYLIAFDLIMFADQ